MPAEVAAALTLTGRSADTLVGLAAGLDGLPLTLAALRAGEIDRPKAVVIAGETTALPPAERARVEQLILPGAGGQTTGQLRAAVQRAVLAADADAARRRREQAGREARVERWPETDGTAALAGRDLPPAGVLTADQHISDLARSLKAAGVAGSLDQLRARVFLALLAGQPAESLLSPAASPGTPAGFMPGPAGAGGTPPAGPPAGLPGADGTASGAPASGAAGAGVLSPGCTPPGASRDSGFPSPASPAGRVGYAPAGAINLTLPLGTWLGLAQTPGDVAGFGPLAASDSRALAESMADHPATRWCLTLTDSTGQAAAHGCARASPRPHGGADRSPGPGPPGRLPAWITGLSLDWLERDGCSHRRECAGYQPSGSLRHLLTVRHRTCSFPGCRRPAAACDQDHTIPYDQGGRTCWCNLAPVCRAHHAAKQAPGWHLGQPQPGRLVWTAPSGRTYTTHPTEYPQ